MNLPVASFTRTCIEISFFRGRTLSAFFTSHVDVYSDSTFYWSLSCEKNECNKRTINK